MTTRITIKEIREVLDESPDFETYVSPLLNLANQFAHGTRPPVVGQMSDLIQEFSGKSLKEWEAWYLDRRPDAIDNATRRILAKVESFRNVLDRVDESVVKAWVRDLVIIKTYMGLRVQEIILKKGAKLHGLDYRLASAEEESQGIDGFIGEVPVSIKPETYKLKSDQMSETIEVPIVFYKKTDKGLEVDYGALKDLISEG